MPVRKQGTMLDYALEVANSPVTIFDGGGKFHGIIVETNGTNDAIVVVSDNGAAVPERYTFKVPGADLYGGFMLPKPIMINDALTVSLSGAGSRVVIHYED